MRDGGEVPDGRRKRGAVRVNDFSKSVRNGVADCTYLVQGNFWSQRICGL